MDRYDIQVKEREGYLYACYYENGKLVKRSLKLKATKQNMLYAQKQIIPNLQTKLVKGESLSGRGKMSFLFKKVESRFPEMKAGTVELYERGIKLFMAHFGDRDASSITILEMDDFIENLSKTRQGSSVSVLLCPISSAFKEAVRLEFISRSPLTLAKKPKVENAVRQAYTVTQMWQLLDTAEGKLKDFLHIAFFTGMRAGEILALEWDDLDTVDQRITVSKSRHNIRGTTTPKSGKSRTIPMVNRLAEYLSNKERQTAMVVKVEYQTLRRGMQDLCKKLGFFYEGLHNTRHTFASLMLQARENPLLVKEFLGHTNLTMINKVYAHYMQDNQDCNKFDTLLSQDHHEARSNTA